jgi:hypothetical protein
MACRISETRYKDQPAVTIESEALAAQFLPSIGAKMASLVYKPLGFELLVQRPGESYRLQPYGGDYLAGECSGFDDMFPTIDECYYSSSPWKGTLIPDHGEVWSLPWECRAEGDRLELAVQGVRFPYRLEKTARFAGSSKLHIDYRLANLSNFDFDFMWAAHLMLNLEEDCELVLPPGVERVISRLSYSGALGRYGEEFPWPAFTLPDGTARDLRRIRPKTAQDAEKYFVKGRLPEGWCALRYGQKNVTLTLSFPADRVPYIGILPNEGGRQDLYNIFLEPCTASFDDLNVAKLRNEFSTVKANSTYEWSLAIAVAQE